MKDTLEQIGYAWLRGVADAAAVGELRAALDVPTERAGARLSGPARDTAAEVLHWPVISAAVAAAVGGPPRLVRAILFDKTAEARWAVQWHRDTMIPVKEHRSSEILVAPSVKNGVPHVRGSVDVLSRMLAVRLHLDPTDGSNGALSVIPRSHCIVSLASPAELSRDSAVLCCAEAGDALLMRPLLLHQSSRPWEGAGRRRVLHLEIAGPQSLPDGFAWPE
jgi:ectoine hydroxylase-related dioxygenase (phytanoyl-CoA dioxygenase family)